MGEFVGFTCSSMPGVTCVGESLLSDTGTSDIQVPKTERHREHGASGASTSVLMERTVVFKKLPEYSAVKIQHNITVKGY